MRSKENKGYNKRGGEKPPQIYEKGPKHMDKLTRRQKDTYDFIVQFALEKNVLPSIREIAKGLGINSVAAIQDTLSLTKKDLLDIK